MMSTTLGDVAVFGMGASGVAVARYCASLLGSRVSSVTCFAGDALLDEELCTSLRASGCVIVDSSDASAGYTRPHSCSHTRPRFDLGVVSPGIPPHASLFVYAQAACTQLIGEAEFAWRESPDAWLVITGTNGKTTTTTLTRDILLHAGISAQDVGNIGKPLTAQLAARRSDSWFVAELSSYQLATTHKLHPRVAALLNISPDHLSWHGSIEHYAAAKEAAFAQMIPGDLAIISRDDAWSCGIARRLEMRGIRVCSVSCKSQPQTEEWAYCDQGILKVQLQGECYELCKANELRIQGTHNIANALVSAAATLEIGADPLKVREALLMFSGLEHRIEDVAVVGGLRFVNDSKATNVDAAQQALSAFEPGSIAILLGGFDKHTDLTALLRDVCATCCVAVCFGEARHRFLSALEDEQARSGSPIRLISAEHLQDAFTQVCSAAPPNSVVLLSPACASFDEFTGFEERGHYFKQLVANYAATHEQHEQDVHVHDQHEQPMCAYDQHGQQGRE